MRDPSWLSLRAVQFLESVLLPRVLKAAGLPLQTPVDELLKLPLKLPVAGKTPDFSPANDYFGELILPGALAMAKELAGAQRVGPLYECLLGLIWRDAEELVTARDLAFETNLPDIDNGEYEKRYVQAQAVWSGWQQADQGLIAEIQTFLETWSSELFCTPVLFGFALRKSWSCCGYKIMYILNCW